MPAPFQENKDQKWNRLEGCARSHVPTTALAVIKPVFGDLETVIDPKGKPVSLFVSVLDGEQFPGIEYDRFSCIAYLNQGPSPMVDISSLFVIQPTS